MAPSRSGRTPAERRERRAEVKDPAPVMEAAAAFLAVRPRSVAETRRRLRHLGYQQALIEQVLGRLVEIGYLDDEQFARAWVESRDRARPRGVAALRRELEHKGVARETVDEVMAERELRGTGVADVDAALRLIERRRSALEREPDARKRRHKAYALLARNGFDPEVCRTASAGLPDSYQEPSAVDD